MGACGHDIYETNEERNKDNYKGVWVTALSEEKLHKKGGNIFE